MRPPLPLLVIVSGSPAAGKTTLATALAKDLALPLFARDNLKELLLDVIGAPDRAHSSELGRASFVLLYDVVGRLLAASVGAVIESNFHRGRAEQELGPLVSRANAVLLHCETSREEIERRYVDRCARGERHHGHHDLDALPSLLSNLDQGVYEPLRLQIPTLRIDTTNGYSPTERQIKAFLHQARTAPSRNPVVRGGILPQDWGRGVDCADAMSAFAIASGNRTADTTPVPGNPPGNRPRPPAGGAGSPARPARTRSRTGR